jgi:hypothetical protein
MFLNNNDAAWKKMINVIYVKQVDSFFEAYGLVVCCYMA